MNLLNPKALQHFLLALACIAIIGLCFTHQLATQHQYQHWQAELKQRATNVAQEIDDELAKFEQIPNLLNHDPRLLAALQTETKTKDLNLLLSDWLAQSLADTIYVHDQTGLVIASSNYQQNDTFIGSNFAFRPYFQKALKGQKAQYVALGVRSKKRGYFFSSPLWLEDKVAGVITVKVNLEQLEQRLAQMKGDILIAGIHDVVFMSNLADWRYRALFPLSEAAKKELTQTQQYGAALPKYNGDLTKDTGAKELVSNHFLISPDYISYTTELFDKNYRVISLINQKEVLKAVLQTDITFLVLYAVIALIALAWFQMLVNKARLADLNINLERIVTERTDFLSQANNKLRHTIEQYKQSQQALKQTQQELTQATKLALLGELSASINHEINQPLAALKTYNENSLRLMAMERYPMVTDNLHKMLDLNGTIAEVIARLKIFTRKTESSPHNEVSILQEAVSNACRILNTQLTKQGITVDIPSIPTPILLAIHNVELEQVLINILHNATQAMTGNSLEPRIAITIRCDEHMCDIYISDNGPGMDQVSLSRIFDPFFTTKPEGLGLGLTISKRILESYQGTLSAYQGDKNQAPSVSACSGVHLGGMTFTIRLPLIKQNSQEAPSDA
ncbi:histidine kinase [Vibrio azureus]|uniref:histidine kinase n=1 Tax=Vibrio azureus NBRC 104587 TaxID=1219077 RepID=U3AL37_9VIBR|nr:ATP-binding protein [Vibrio azureus]AUI87518.1 histidine kinase [Vibrio azureus]GAD74485.1 putative two-component histidine kinase [Vibrio azureus NBRC 104587]